MPYIKKEDRHRLAPLVSSMSNNEIKSAGELNYLLTQLCLSYLGSPNYEKLNAIVGALDCCKEELRRRVINPYEDRKIKENGDVYQ